MDRRWSLLGLALVLGAAGFALAIGLDEIDGSSSWPGGPEIVLVLAVALTLAAAVGLAWVAGQRSLPNLGLVVLATAAGFGLAWLGFQALIGIGGGCGYTPELRAETGLAGAWDAQTAREGLESQGLAVGEPRARSLTGSTTLDGGTTFRVYVSQHHRQTNASHPDVRLTATFWPEESRETSDAAQNWTIEERDRLEQRFETFLAGFEEDTGWEQQGNATWGEGTIVC